VAKEAPAVNTRDGVPDALENTAPPEALDYSSRSTPFDIQDQADASIALTMDPEEKAGCSRGLKEIISPQPGDWSDDQSPISPRRAAPEP